MEKYLNKLDKILELHSEAKEQEAFEYIKQLRETIIFDIAQKNCNNKFEKEQLKYAKELLKSAQQDKSRILLHKQYQYEDTYQLCDGYVAVVLKAPIKGLELNTADGEYFDCRTIINRTGKNYYDYDDDYKEVDIDILELEQLAIKIKKYKEPPYPIEILRKKFDTYYHPLNLLTAVRLLGTENVKAYFHTTNGKDPIYLKSDLGEGVVLPILLSQQKNKDIIINEVYRDGSSK